MRKRRALEIFETEDLKVRALSAAVSILVVVGCYTHREFARWDFDGEVFLRLAIGLTLIAGATVALCRIWTRPPDKNGDWWNVGDRLNNPSWDDVRRMTLGEYADDPVAFQPQLRHFSSVAKATLGYVIIGCLTLEALSFLAEGPVLPRLLSRVATETRGVDLNLNGNLTAFLALLAAAVSIYFTHRQLQAKVKADSRQAWIDKLRAHIARFIALADAIHEAPTEQARQDKQLELTSCRLEIELMLNPSEKDHRLLMFLGLKLAFFEVGESHFEVVDDVKNVRQAIKEDCVWGDISEWNPLIGRIPIPRKKSKQREKLYSDLIGYKIRLSHVVLKREWERVKATR